MTTAAEIIGWFMIALFVACTPLIVLGLKQRRQSKREADLEEKRLNDEFPPLRSSHFAPYVPDQWKRTESGLDDQVIRDTPPPSDPAF